MSEGEPKSEPKAEAKAEAKPKCFVLMPYSDPEGYEDGHFRNVYRDIFEPACELAGFDPIRADTPPETSIIHLDMLKQIVESPMALCDLSAGNPNVFFELGLRQAFDKPVLLVQEVDTKRRFDLVPLRAMDYRKRLDYREVIEDQRKIATSLKATYKASANPDNSNSLVALLSIAAAKIIKSDATANEQLARLLMAEMSETRNEVRRQSDQLQALASNSSVYRLSSTVPMIGGMSFNAPYSHPVPFTAPQLSWSFPASLSESDSVDHTSDEFRTAVTELSNATGMTYLVAHFALGDILKRVQLPLKAVVEGLKDGTLLVVHDPTAPDGLRITSSYGEH